MDPIRCQFVALLKCEAICYSDNRVRTALLTSPKVDGSQRGHVRPDVSLAGSLQKLPATRPSTCYKSPFPMIWARLAVFICFILSTLVTSLDLEYAETAYR